jgi:K+-sensing histidine kinase KdpD
MASDEDLKNQPEVKPALELDLRKAKTRIRQLQLEIVSRKEENDRIIAQNLRQHEELRNLNLELDHKVTERTRELEASKAQLELQNQELTEVGESKEAMMHMIVHDMKNPLTSVMGTLCLLQNKNLNLNKDLQELVLGAHIQAIKLRCMIDDILTISRMKSKEFKIEPMAGDLVSLVQQSMLVMETTKGERKVSFRFASDFQELNVLIDFPLVERVINNLINNAMKYAPPGSEIFLEVGRKDNQAMVSVTNWGSVIPANYHTRIFELFCRVKEQDPGIKGTGLGLAFCKLAVEAHGTVIYVESPVPEHANGARFTFTLPLAPETPVAENPSAA